MGWKQAGMPDPLKEYSVSFPKLDGGLNTWELDHRLKDNESPEMVNLWWKDGVLCSRDGQALLYSGENGVGWSAYEGVFHNSLFFHIGDTLYRADTVSGEEELSLTFLTDGVPENRGTWFCCGDALYYKNRGGYYRITCTELEGFGPSELWLTEEVSRWTYTPVVRINADPATGVGEEYQGENRLCAQKTVWYSTVEGVRDYRLPVQNVDSVDKVVVDGTELTGGYTVDLAAGTVSFDTEPTHHEPAQSNTVRITYTKTNAEAYNSIMDCSCAAVYGGDQNVCVVLGGCKSQPNAFFWCGRHTVMDPGYFPAEQYNIAGDDRGAITGFGKQQNMLVIFKERSIGKAALRTQETAGGGVRLTMNYTAINAAIGCDIPGSIQLVENNLVFANTRNGICIVRDSSSTYENNITPISRKVDNGLLPLLKRAETVCSYDDGERYWLAADGEVYVWDYTLSRYSDPVWFHFTDIRAAAFVTADQKTLHLDSAGRITEMRRNYRDYDAPICKKYRFAAQYMGDYDRLKDITGVIFAVRGDTDTLIRVSYETDHEKREDLTPVRTTSWRLFPRNLGYRELGVRRFAAVARRRPGCRHVRHFTMELNNNELGMDMAVISAQVLYRYQGRNR